MADLQQPPQAASSRALDALLGFCVGMLLFGDYLTLTVSRAITGSSGNWIAFAAALQPTIVLLLLLLGQVRAKLPLAVLLSFAGLCMIGFGHAVPIWLHGNELSEYSGQKLAALFLLLAHLYLPTGPVGRYSAPHGRDAERDNRRSAVKQPSAGAVRCHRPRSGACRTSDVYVVGLRSLSTRQGALKRRGRL